MSAQTQNSKLKTQNWRSSRAFTMVEMMVVLLVSLTLMTMIVPIFKVSTKTVQVVERRLAVYEAARNQLDLIEAEMQLAFANERGDHFSIKHTSWDDTDHPFTPLSTPVGVGIVPGIADASSLSYKQSRRVADCVDYLRLEGKGANSNWIHMLEQFPGGKFFALAVPIMEHEYPEAWKCSMRSTLIYQYDLEWYQDWSSDKNQGRWNRPEQLSDVSQIEMTFVFASVTDESRYNNNAGTVGGDRHFDQIPNILGPGKEIKFPQGMAGDIGFEMQRRLGQIKLMDLAISYWDDTPSAGGGKVWRDLPDNTAIYFFPMPKALRATITVCDYDKRDILTLCRVMALPCGSGDGNALLNVGAAADTAYFSDKPQPGNNSNMAAVYNRTKYMPKLPNAFNGDGQSGWPSASSCQNCTENTIITVDGVKPINWP